MKNVSVETSLGKQRVMLTIQPMMRLGEPSGLFLAGVSRRRSSDGAQRQSVGKATMRRSFVGAADRAADAMIEQLERELASTRDDLDRLMQDMEATQRGDQVVQRRAPVDERQASVGQRGTGNFERRSPDARQNCCAIRLGPSKPSG
ncbi:MAG: hypothetical protein R3C56_21090 [Pirellulaceae bacterium]